jgi:hypothetical protein
MIDKELRFKRKSAIKLGKEIYLYENFYEDLDSIEQPLIQMEEKDWSTHGNYEVNDHGFEYWNNILSLDFVERKFHDSIINFVSPEYWILSHGNFMRLRKEDSAPIYNNSMPDSIEYVLAYYAGDFTGGEILFLDSDIKYQPKKNDLIIFKPCSFDISPVISGTRYSYLDYLIRHPGYIVV